MSARNINEIVADYVLENLVDDPEVLVEIAYEDDTGAPSKAKMASRLAAHIEGRVKDIIGGEIDDEDLQRAIIRASGLRVSEVREYVDLDNLVRRAEREQKRISAAKT